MVRNPPEGYQRIIPCILYEDTPAAPDDLCRCFGFEERLRMPGPGGRIMHAEVGYQDNVVMLATAVPEMGHASPKNLPARHGTIACYDVDAHHAGARAEGAEILSGPEDQFYGDRSYRARDPEGHEWFFMTHVRDVAAEDMVPPEA